VNVHLYIRIEKRARERKLFVCLMLIFSLSLSLSLSFFFLSFESVMLFGLQMTFIHCLHKCECTQFQVVLGTINRKLSCMMIDDLSVSACGQAKGASLTLSYIYIYIHLTRLISKNNLNNGKFAFKTS
jgi:hypothetical protein